MDSKIINNNDINTGFGLTGFTVGGIINIRVVKTYGNSAFTVYKSGAPGASTFITIRRIT